MLAALLLSKRFLSVPKYSFPYLCWCLAYIGVCVLSLLLVNNDDTAYEGFVAYIWYFASSVVLVLYVRSVSEVKACGYAIVIAVLLLSILTLMEFTNPDFQVIVDAVAEDVNSTGGINRAASLYTNQNVTGVAIVLGALIGQMFLPRTLRLLFLVFVGIAVFGTVSRSAITLWALVVMSSFWFGFLSGNRIWVKLCGLFFIVGLGYLLLDGQIPTIIANMGFSELLSPSMTDRLSENFFTQDDNSNEGRYYAAVEGWNIFVNNPVSGIGIGASEKLPVTGIATHNQHIEIAAELGVLGWLTYATIVLLALKANTKHALLFVFLILVISFTAHWLLNFPVFGMYLAAALVFLPALSKHRDKVNRHSKKKRRRKSKSRKEFTTGSYRM